MDKIDQIRPYSCSYGRHDPVISLHVEEQPDGTLSYGDDHLYERGYGLSFSDSDIQ